MPGRKNILVRCQTCLASLLLAAVFGVAAQPTNLPSFWKSRLPDIDVAVKEVKKGETRVLAEPYAKLTHEQILDIELLKDEELFKFATDHPVKWAE